MSLKVFGLKYRAFSMKTIYLCLLAIALSLSLMSCGKLNLATTPDTSINISSQLSETAPPKLIRDLSHNLKSYQPKVALLFPKPGTKLRETEAIVQISVKDFPLFKDKKLGLGFNLHLILDNEPYTTLYSVEEPIKLENLTPGTHTLRVFACFPWHESLKTPESFAETTFSVLTETEDNYPRPDLPLLTYNQPTGNYSKEPIMLDFQISDPSQKSLKPGDTLSKTVKVTINDESFIVNQWQPLYLEGFKEGNNLVQLELIDSEGKKIDNTFNSTVRLITYRPNSPDPLSKIVTNQINLEEAQSIINPEYYENLAKESSTNLEKEADKKPAPKELPTVGKESKILKTEDSSQSKSESKTENKAKSSNITEKPKVIDSQVKKDPSIENQKTITETVDKSKAETNIESVDKNPTESETLEIN